MNINLEERFASQTLFG